MSHAPSVKGGILASGGMVIGHCRTLNRKSHAELKNSLDDMAVQLHEGDQNLKW